MMEMLIKSICMLLVVVPHTTSAKISCHMVSFQIEDALSGYCCVFVKNNSEIQQQREEIKQQILENFKNETVDDVPSSTEVSEVSEVKSEDEESSEKTVSPLKTRQDKIKFPGSTNFEQDKNITVKHHKNIVSDKNKNGTVFQNNLNQSETYFLNGTSKNNTSINNTTPVITINRNAVDTPETCPDGNEKDHNGDCVPVF